MRQKITFLVMIFGICLNGCYFVGFSYPGPERGDGIHWGKKGLSYEEVRQFHRQCYPRWVDMYGEGYNYKREEISGELTAKHEEKMTRDLVIKLEIEGQACMLGHGFHFNDTPPPHRKLCSKGYSMFLGLDSYMIFPACRAKYGKYRK